MNESIKKIYDLLYSPLVTPYNLLSNVKLDNYDYINYYKCNGELITEMKCTSEEGFEELFYYHFDNNDFLQKIYRKEDDGKTLLFSRKDQIVIEEDNFIETRNKELVKHKVV